MRAIKSEIALAAAIAAEARGDHDEAERLLAHAIAEDNNRKG